MGSEQVGQRLGLASLSQSERLPQSLAVGMADAKAQLLGEVEPIEELDRRRK